MTLHSNSGFGQYSKGSTSYPQIFLLIIKYASPFIFFLFNTTKIINF